MRAEPDQSHPLGISRCARTAQVHKQTMTQGRKPPAAVPTIQLVATTGHNASKQGTVYLTWPHFHWSKQ